MNAGKPGERETTIRFELARACLRIFLFGLLAAIPLLWSRDESDGGNRAFLLALAAMATALLAWSLVDSAIAVRAAMKRRRGRRDRSATHPARPPI